MLMNWDPFTDLRRIQRDFAAPERATFRPAVDIREDDDAYYLVAELPGLTSDDIHLEVENDVLTLRGERRAETSEDKNGWRHVERSFGAFRRSFHLPKSVNADSLAAELQDGVLNVTLPKRAKPSPRRIEVRAPSA